MTHPPAGTFQLGDSGRLTVFEPVAASNPPAGSESWPLVDASGTTQFTLMPQVSAARSDIATLTHQLVERLAGVPAEQRAEILAEIGRAVAAAG